jgi:hypothetical protein
MNHETICNPIPAADVPGFQFYRDQNGRTIARCVVCRVGFVVTTGLDAVVSENWERKLPATVKVLSTMENRNGASCLLERLA